MRQIGTIADETDARTFADYLLTLGITTRLDHQDDGWTVWVHKEDHVPQASRELDGFRTDPRAQQYQGVDQAARRLRREAERADRLHRRNTVDLRGRLRGGPRLIESPVTFALLIVSVAVTLLRHFDHTIVPIDSWLAFTTYDQGLDGRWYSNGLGPIVHGQLWRLVTPIFLHFGPLHLPIHLLFNMLMLIQLGPLIEWRWGTRRMAELVLVTAIVSNLGQFLLPDLFTFGPIPRGLSNFGGMSGVLYGLFGYLWMKSRYDHTAGFVLQSDTVFYMVGWLVLCMTGALRTVANVSVANTAHVVGLVVGMLFGLIPYWRARFFG